MADVANNGKRTGGVTGKGFKPGQSGNPSGRPAIAKAFRDRCREFMEAEEGGWDILITMAKGGGSDKRAACELLAAYAYGKPTQGLEVSGEGGGPVVIKVNIRADKDASSV